MTKEELKRYRELYKESTDLFLSYSDFDPLEWIKETNIEEFKTLQNKFFGE